MSCRIEKLARIFGNDAHVRETLAERLQVINKKNGKYINVIFIYS